MNLLCMRDQCKGQTSCLGRINAGRIFFFLLLLLLLVLIRHLDYKPLHAAKLSWRSVCTFGACFEFQEIWLSCVTIGSDLTL